MSKNKKKRQTLPCQTELKCAEIVNVMKEIAAEVKGGEFSRIEVFCTCAADFVECLRQGFNYDSLKMSFSQYGAIPVMTVNEVNIFAALYRDFIESWYKFSFKKNVVQKKLVLSEIIESLTKLVAFLYTREIKTETICGERAFINAANNSIRVLRDEIEKRDRVYDEFEGGELEVESTTEIQNRVIGEYLKSLGRHKDAVNIRIHKFEPILGGLVGFSVLYDVEILKK